MTQPLTSAEWAPHARKVSGTYTGGPVKALLHATMTPSHILPGYKNQSIAPQLTITYNTVRKVARGWQHYYWTNFGKALRNTPGGVETNRDSVLQVELSGYLGANNYKIPTGEFDILTAPDTYWEQVAEIVGHAWVSWRIPNVIPADWTQSGRMTLSQWDNFSGLCAHVHAPENVNWDIPMRPEALDTLRRKIWIKPGPIITPKPVPVPVIPTLPKKPATPVPPVVKAPHFPYPPPHYFGVFNATDKYAHSGRYSATDRGHIRMWQKQMRIRGWKIDVDGLFGPQSKAVATQFQREKKLTVDGKVGARTWAASWTARIT